MTPEQWLTFGVLACIFALMPPFDGDWGDGPPDDGARA